MTMATARRAKARRDTMMVTGDDDNDFNGDGVTGNKFDVDGGGTTGDDNNDNDDGDNDDDGNGYGAMGSGATGYDDDDDGNGQRRQRCRWQRRDGQRDGRQQ